MKEIKSKACMLGDSEVGKTSLVRRFVKNEYRDTYKSTLGTVVHKKSIFLPDRKEYLKMMIWDIAGQAEFKRAHSTAFQNSQGALAVCDVSREKTIDNLHQWINNYHNNTNDSCPVIILANKFDLIKDKKNKVKRIREELEGFDYPFYFTSAKTGHKVESTFQDLGSKIRDVNGSEAPSKAKKVEKEIPSVPENLGSCEEFMDFVIDRFCKSVGDQEMGNYMVREQMQDLGVDFKNMKMEEGEELIDRLVSITENHMDKQASKKLKRDLKRSLQSWREW